MRKLLLLFVLVFATLAVAASLYAEDPTPAPSAVVAAAAAPAQAPSAVAAGSADDEKYWTFEAFTGSAYQFHTPLHIAQDDQPVIKINARYATKPFYEALYYDWRFAKWKGNRAKEIEFIHHKLYLINTTSEVEQFDITHGYNLLYYNQARKVGDWIHHVGGGIVITHPENIVRGLRLETGGVKGLSNNLSKGGYHLSGVTAQYAIGRQFPVAGRLFATVEGKITVSYARVPVVDGHANVPNVALHGIFGLGYRF